MKKSYPLFLALLIKLIALTALCDDASPKVELERLMALNVGKLADQCKVMPIERRREIIDLV